VIMATATAGKPLAAKKRSDGTPPVSVKLPADVVEMARIASAYRNIPMGDLLGDLLRPALIEMVREETVKWAKSKKGGE
jgi:hypothetical protein